MYFVFSVMKNQKFLHVRTLKRNTKQSQAHCQLIMVARSSADRGDQSIKQPGRSIKNMKFSHLSDIPVLIPMIMFCNLSCLSPFL